VVSAYNIEIMTQDNYIKKNIQKPTNCYYEKNGNFGCRSY